MRIKQLVSLCTTLTALAVTAVVLVPDTFAADKTEAAAAKKAKKEKDALEKYDKNLNGKLDEDELTAMKADDDQLKAEKKTAAAEKKKKKEAAKMAEPK